jgi:transposase
MDTIHPFIKWSDSGANMDMRELKALEIAARCRVEWKNGVWEVPSQTSPTTKYRVTLQPEPSCDCDDFQLRRQPCKHVIAARLVQERDHGGIGPKIDTDVVPKRPTYKQDWPAYNKAQREEKDRLQVLLADLCSGVVDPPREGVGRKPVPVADRLFAVVFKVYSTISSRRFACDLDDAHERGFLSRPLHCNKVNCFLEDADLTPYLRALIVRSSLPLRSVETDFAVDSSGFSTSKFVRWFDEKYGVTRSGHDWVKVHLACGVKTGVVTAAAIYERDAGDCPILPELVKGTAENFTVKEVSADKAYLSVENVETIFAAGGIPFIAPKSNTTGGAGGLFEKMFHFYQFQRKEFLSHYHKRSNVESTFSAIKRKFGDSVRSRTSAAMVNEVLAKLVCHNLCCVILSQIELGIEPVFWKNDAVASDGNRPAVLPMVRPG